MKEAYIYPITAFASKIIPNPYLENLMDSLSPEFRFLNRSYPSNTGIFDLLKYIGKIRYIFLNWIEDLPDKKSGNIQVIFFVLAVWYLKARRVKIIWTLHNKASHYESNRLLKNFLFRFVIRKSDFIITHSKEGIRYLGGYHLKKPEKVAFYPHPLEKKFVPPRVDKKYDILLWGSIIPYKGIDKFLELLYQHEIQHKYKILVAGKVKPVEYEKTISGYCNKQILLDNRYIPEEELKHLVAETKIVLFTYEKGSVLSSGVLMDTLSYGGNVIAPDVGAFKDAAEDGLISTYVNSEEMLSCIDRELGASGTKPGLIERFIEENTWNKFSEKLIKWLN